MGNRPQSHQPLITLLAHTPLHTVKADTWMVEAAAQMQRLKVRHHPAVVNAEGLLVGVVQLHRIMVRLGEQLQHQHTEAGKVRLQQRARKWPRAGWSWPHAPPAWGFGISIS